MHVARQLKRILARLDEIKILAYSRKSELMKLALIAVALLLLQQHCAPAGTTAGAVRLQQMQLQHEKKTRSEEILGSEAAGATLRPSSMQCTGSTSSKRSCLFSNVCLQLDAEQHAVTAWLLNPRHPEQYAAVLQQHLAVAFNDTETYASVTTNVVVPSGSHTAVDSSSSSSNCDARGVASYRNLKSDSRVSGSAYASISGDAWDAAGFQTEHAVTLLWRNHRSNQGSFGHALVNEAFPIFLVLQNHFGQQVPSHLQLLATPTMEHVLHHVIRGTITHQAHLIEQRFAQLPKGSKGICFRELLVGDGGYQRASRASLANSNIYQGFAGVNHHTRYAREPSFFSSSNWWNFRQHALQLNGVSDSTTAGALPLVVLNDKRHGDEGKPDRRSIMDVDGVAASLTAAFPGAEVQAVRFRDLAWPDQLRLMSRSKVFITTQGSSAFRLVFMPRGSVCIMIGAPEPTGSNVWSSFHELDRWFPLTYLQFIRYEVSVANEHEYNAAVWPGVWQPDEDENGGKTRRAWWLYNADIQLNMSRLLPMVESALLQQ